MEKLRSFGQYVDSTQSEKQNQNHKRNYGQKEEEKLGTYVQQKNGREQINKQEERIKKIFLDKILEDGDKQLQEEEDIAYDELSQSSVTEYIPDLSDCESDLQAENGPFTTRLNYNVLNKDTTKSSLTVLVSTPKNYGEQIGEGVKLPSANNVDGVNVSFGKFMQSSTSNIEQFANIRPWTKKSSCPYCYQDVTHFPRHLQRNHESEDVVREFLSMNVRNPKRKELLNIIRRQGNFISTSCTNIIRPIRRPNAHQNNTAGDTNLENLKEEYIICQDCLGYYKRNYLRRHRKHCALRLYPGELGNQEQHLSAAQLFTVCSGHHNDFYSMLRLKNEVFPIMRNDEISKTAMKDTLICLYAESLLRKHKRTQIRNVISNKMRELGRFVLTLKTITGLQRLFDVLKPQFFDNCVSAAKVISGYDKETRTFKASSLALHMGTTLKQVCDIATKMVIKKSALFSSTKPEETLKDIERLKNLVENHWNSEISSLTPKNLNEQAYEKPKMLPLTQDVMQFQQFVLTQAKEACNALRESRQIKVFYRSLSECVLALTLLLNRKRIGEIQYLKLKTYYKTCPENQQEEFLQALSEAERMLTKKFKRVVTEGKGSKPLAILFPREIQEFIEVLISVRNLCVPDTNEYLFANPNTKNGWLSGYHTMKKLAEESGVKNKGLFTSTRLRKQIATVLQVLNITEDEMEQFAKFMGHTKKIRASYCRLPQDIYQTAKVSKLLIAINSGKSSTYKGKSLDEIQLSVTEDDDSDSEKINANDKNRLMEDVEAHDDPMSDDNASSNFKVHIVCHKKVQKKKISRVKWSNEQKKLIIHHFKENIEKKVAPRKQVVEAFRNKHKEIFKEKNWVKVKAFVYNCYR